VSYLRQPGPVDLTRLVQLVQQHLVQAHPHAGVIPVAQTPPAGHAGSAAHLGRQVLPGDTGLQDEQDPRQRPAIGDPLAPRIAIATLDDRQQRLNSLPQRIIHKRLGHSRELRRSFP
jgi:hypothetical protein